VKVSQPEFLGPDLVEPLVLAFGLSELVGPFELVLDVVLDPFQFAVDHLLDAAHHLLLQLLVGDVNAHVEHLQ
jgi:hypothetical protein